MNNLDNQYKKLLEQILKFGVEKKDRTGTGTLSVFGWQIRHNMKEGFPLLTTKKMAWKSIVTELLWFLRGDTNIKYLVDNSCHIWDGDAYQNYRKIEFERIMSQNDGEYLTGKEEFINKIKTDDEFAKKWGELGPIYGRQWRDWGGKDEVKLTNDKDENGYLKFKTEHISGIDQIKNLISELKTNPDSRRLMVSAWNVGELGKMVLPPCHYGFQVYTRELSLQERMILWENINNKDVMDFPIGPLTDDQYHSVLDNIGVQKRAISLMWNQRSVDTFLGLPFNIASYGLLLQLLAKEVHMIPEGLIGNLADCHLYMNHIEQAKEQIIRTSFDLPKLRFSYEFETLDWFLNHPKKDKSGSKIYNYNEFFNQLRPEWFQIENYQYHPTIKAKLSN